MSLTMLRVYLSNDSYPELRDVPFGWARSLTWWRAILHALRQRGFWVFGAAQALVLAAFVAAGGLTLLAEARWGLQERLLEAGLAAAALGLFCYLQVSWGGDLMRPHLRAVSDVARHACPSCGHSLRAHLAEGRGPLRCPECAACVERDLFAPPYRVPERFLAFPPWRRAR